MTWIVYILKCKDNTLYCGITNNLKERIQKHNEGTGAKYTRGRGPVKLVYSTKLPDRSSASKEEARVKKLTRAQKLELINRDGAT